MRPGAEWRLRGRVVAQVESPGDGKPLREPPVLAGDGLVGLRYGACVVGVDADSLACRFSHPVVGEAALAASKSEIVVYTPHAIRWGRSDGGVRSSSLTGSDSSARGALVLADGDLLLWSAEALRRVSPGLELRWEWRSHHWGDPCHDDDPEYERIAGVVLGLDGTAWVGLGRAHEPFQHLRMIDSRTGAERQSWPRPSVEPWFATRPGLLASEPGLVVGGIGIGLCRHGGDWAWLDDDASAMAPLGLAALSRIAYACGHGTLALRDLSGRPASAPLARVELDGEPRACAGHSSGFYVGTEHGLYGIDLTGKVFLRIRQLPVEQLLLGPGWLLAIARDGMLSRIE